MPRLLAAILAAALIATACAGDDDGGERSATPGEGSPVVTVAPTAAATGTAPSGASALLVYVLDGNLFTYEPEQGVKESLGAACDGFANLTAARAGAAFISRCHAGGTTTLRVWREGAIRKQRTVEGESFSPAESFSNDGRYYAYIVPGADGGLDLETGAVLLDTSPHRVANVQPGHAWAPNDARIAFCRPAGDACMLGVFDVDAGAEIMTDIDARPLGWAARGRIVAALNYVPSQDPGVPRAYDAALIDVDTGTETPFPALDDRYQLWFSPDGGYAATTVREAQLPLRVAVIDLASGDITTIPESQISFPSDHIPPDHVQFGDDGYLYWLDGPLPTTLYRARLPGGAAERLVEAPGFVTFAPAVDWIAVHRYSTSPDGDMPALIVQPRREGGAQQRVEEGNVTAAAWLVE